MSDDDLITVCEFCLRASCWQGDLFCENFYESDVIQKTRRELRKLALENESYWQTDHELIHSKDRSNKLKYFVVSGNCRQAEQWAREHDLSRDNLRHVRDLTDLQGLLPNTLYIVETALRDRNNIERLLDYAREMGWKLDFGNPDGSYF